MSGVVELSMLVPQLKHPLELFVKSMEFLPDAWFPLHRDMSFAVESNVKQSFIPSSNSRTCSDEFRWLESGDGNQHLSDMINGIGSADLLPT